MTSFLKLITLSISVVLAFGSPREGLNYDEQMARKEAARLSKSMNKSRSPPSRKWFSAQQTTGRGVWKPKQEVKSVYEKEDAAKIIQRARERELSHESHSREKKNPSEIAIRDKERGRKEGTEKKSKGNFADLLGKWNNLSSQNESRRGSRRAEGSTGANTVKKIAYKNWEPKQEVKSAYEKEDAAKIIQRARERELSHESQNPSETVVRGRERARRGVLDADDYKNDFASRRNKWNNLSSQNGSRRGSRRAEGSTGANTVKKLAYKNWEPKKNVKSAYEKEDAAKIIQRARERELSHESHSREKKNPSKNAVWDEERTQKAKLNRDAHHNESHQMSLITNRIEADKSKMTNLMEQRNKFLDNDDEDSPPEFLPSQVKSALKKNKSRAATKSLKNPTQPDDDNSDDASYSTVSDERSDEVSDEVSDERSDEVSDERSSDDVFA